jgi:hypothetical protein
MFYAGAKNIVKSQKSLTWIGLVWECNMKIIKFLFGLLIVAAIAYFAIGYFLPNDWQVSRTIMIHRSPDVIYPYVANLKKWPEWSPWGKEADPTLEYTYEGSRMGEGSQQNWTSQKMGKGWLRINEADPLTGISYDLYIDMNDMKSQLKGRIAFANIGGASTQVTWTDFGSADGTILKRWMAQLIRFMLGRQLDEGLLKLKMIVETNPGVS